MADYRFAAQVISRSQGRSVTAAAAYRSATVIADARTGEIHDYTRKTGVEWTGIMAPDDAPAWVQDREKLWNMVEQKEIRKDAQLAREVQLSLPHELNFEQRQGLVRDFVQREFVRRGMTADIAMHKPDRGGDQRNFHVHILLTTRDIGPDGFGKKNRQWNSREELTAMRAAWSDIQNAHLRQHLGPEAPQVTHLSYAERGVEKIATIHLGPIATGMERKGMETVLGDYNRDAARRNQSTRQSRERMAEIENILERRVTRSFGYVANEAKLEAKKAIDDKRMVEKSLQDILARKKSLTATTSPKALEAQVLRETRAEIRALKKRIEATRRQGRSLRKKVRSVSLWVTNPARMIWLKIAELHQRDRLVAALRMAEAKLTVRREWLRSYEGRTWMNQSRRVPELRTLRTEERKARRHVRAAERRVGQALVIAKEAEGLKSILYGKANVPSGIDLPENPGDSRKYLATMAARLQAAQQALPEDLRRKLALELSRGRSQSR
jgi:ATP-dependent exoDNAse (exonuclease V) alpha subunit